MSRARERIKEALAQNCGIVNALPACLCHCRLTRAEALGRVHADTSRTPRVELPIVREQIQRIDMAEGAAAYYRADPTIAAQRDFVAGIRQLLATDPQR